MDPSTDPLLGTLVAGRYRVIKPLGEGGMGQVYLAEHEAIEKKVALKVLKREYSEKPDIVTRFQQEAISASRIKHPNVLDVFDFGQLDNGCFFLAMEFLEGHDLAVELEQQRVLSPERGVRIALQICRALSAAHSKGVVHRDMKPENVFLQRTADGEEIVKIVDFGIAQLRTAEEAAASQPQRRRLTKTGMIFGTPEYMAPEQAAGKKADHRVDIYAVGIILYEMFTGAVPFTGETFMAVLAAHLNDAAPPMRSIAPELALSPEFEALILRTLVKKPEERFQSMQELSQAILATPEGSGMAPLTVHGSIAEGLVSQYAPHLAPATPGQSSPPPPSPLQGTQAQFVEPMAGAPGTLVSTAATAAERSGTQLGAETVAGLPGKGSSKAGLWVGLAALLLVGGGAAAFAMKGSAGAAEPGATASTDPVAIATASEAPAVVTTATAEPSASVAPVASVTPAPNKIKIDVVSEPADAIVTKNGFQVCDTTPCEVLANPDESFELEATKGRQRGTAKVLATNDQRVTITLSAAPAPGPLPGKTKPTTTKPTQRMCEVEVDGLKILRPCP